jgi:hypothetical protein
MPVVRGCLRTAGATWGNTVVSGHQDTVPLQPGVKKVRAGQPESIQAEGTNGAPVYCSTSRHPVCALTLRRGPTNGARGGNSAKAPQHTGGVLLVFVRRFYTSFRVGIDSVDV